jgi:ankyrin repeat protein
MKKTGFMVMLLFMGLSIGATDIAAVTETRSAMETSRAMATAIAAGDVDALNKILKSNPSAVKIRDRDNRTPLHYCAERPIIIAADQKPHIDGDYRNWLANSKVMAEALIAYKADVNANDVFHHTPLHNAASSGNIEVAKVLLANKADVNAKDRFYSSTALHLAALNGNIFMAKLLIENGAEVNAKDKFGTPLTTAVGHRDMVELLLNSKADVQMKNGDGFAPIHLAGDRETAQLLLDHGQSLTQRVTRAEHPYTRLP